jgi:chromosome segregation ATPase
MTLLWIVDQSAESRYKILIDNLETSEEKVQEDKEAHKVLLDKVEQLKGAWLPEIRRLVAKINTNFSEAFKTVGIGGEVVFNESSDDFSKYSIDLRVRFREEAPLITLDSAYHSGGESSTATILYLMALQGVTVAPFRVVDEINQGMDSVNERQVFKLLCDAATAVDTPQCFLLTPKLLPDLPYSDDVTVLQIMNGLHISDVANGYSSNLLLEGQAVVAR